MTNEPPFYYLDSDVLISYVEGTTGRADLIEAIMQEAVEDKYKLITSTVSIAEVAFHEREKRKGTPDPDNLQAIAALWEPPSPIELVEFHRLIGETARDLIRRSAIEKGWSGLRSVDAIHLATAKRMNAKKVFTYEPKWKKYTSMIGCEMIGEPVPDQLPLDLTEQYEAASD